MATETKRAREQWSSQIAFIVAAVGSAIGFGNVWRFPNLAFEYGGGAFFIPYVLALFLIGIPILVLEVAIGQYHQTGDAGAFGRINKRFRGLGLSSVFLSFVVVIYYNALLAWVCRMFVYSIQGSDGRWAGARGSEGWDWFKDTVTGLSPDNANLSVNGLVGPNVGALAFVWLVVFLALAFGVKWTGRVAFITVGLPVVMLFILLIRGVTLDGAGDGVKEYIGRWDMSVLGERGDVWSKAVSQIFFSLSIAFGVMTAYGSYNDRRAPVFRNSVIIALSNSFFSFIAGFAVFGIAGYLAKQEGITVNKLNIGGPALMFGTYPVALSTLPGGGHWERLFFIALFMLGIDSAFSIAEAFVTVLSDSAMFHRLPRAVIVGFVSLIGFLFGLLYCTNTGLLFLDVTDFYVNFMLLLVGFFESFVVGWAYGAYDQMAKVGKWPVLAFTFTNFGSVIVASGVWFGVVKNDPPGGWSAKNWSIMWGFIALILCTLAGLAVTALLAARTRASQETIGALSAKEYVIELLIGNLKVLHRQLTPVVGYIPDLWFFLIRFGIPHVLLILFANLAASETEKGRPQFGNYGDLPRGYQALGIVLFTIAIGIVAIGVVVPDLYKCFSISTYKEEDGEEGTEVMSDDAAKLSTPAHVDVAEVA